MCSWCNPETKPVKATYKIDSENTKFTIGIEGDEIVVYRYPPNFKSHANMALELVINYCPMCGRALEHDEWDDEDEEQ